MSFHTRGPAKVSYLAQSKAARVEVVVDSFCQILSPSANFVSILCERR